RTNRPKTKRRSTRKPPRRTTTAQAPQTSDKKEIALLSRQLNDALERQAATARELSQALDQYSATSRELSESLERAAATSEVFGIIRRWPSELRRVFGVMLANAAPLCGADFGILSRYDGSFFRVEALQARVSAFGESLRREPPRPDPRNAL